MAVKVLHWHFYNLNLEYFYTITLAMHDYHLKMCKNFYHFIVSEKPPFSGLKSPETVSADK